MQSQQPIETISCLFKYYQDGIKPDLSNVFFFSVNFEPKIPEDNQQKRMQVLQVCWPEIQGILSKPAIYGINLISSQQPKMVPAVFQAKEYTVTIEKTKYKYSFFKKYLQKFISEINEAGEKRIFLKDQNQTVLKQIDSFYFKNQKLSLQQKRIIAKNALIHQIVQANYGDRAYYKIKDITFKHLTEEFATGEMTSIIDFYKTKHNIDIKKPKQPLLKAEGPSGQQEILVPELCLMTEKKENGDQ